MNYTRISDVKLLGGAGDLDDESWGGALQVGFDYRVADNGYISVDLKRIYIGSDVKVGGATVGEINLDPTVLAIGYGFRF